MSRSTSKTPEAAAAIASQKYSALFSAIEIKLLDLEITDKNVAADKKDLSANEKATIEKKIQSSLTEFAIFADRKNLKKEDAEKLIPHVIDNINHKLDIHRIMLTDQRIDAALEEEIAKGKTIEKDPSANYNQQKVDLYHNFGSQLKLLEFEIENKTTELTLLKNREKYLITTIERVKAPFSKDDKDVMSDVILEYLSEKLHTVQGFIASTTINIESHLPERIKSIIVNQNKITSTPLRGTIPDDGPAHTFYNPPLVKNQKNTTAKETQSNNASVSDRGENCVLRDDFVRPSPASASAAAALPYGAPQTAFAAPNTKFMLGKVDMTLFGAPDKSPKAATAARTEISDNSKNTGRK